MQNTFYVYVIFRLNGIPCYIGKGKGNRWKYHRRNDSNRHLLGLMRQANGRLPTVIIRNFISEAEAFEIEKALIAAIGRHPFGPLVNMTDGGEGISGYKFDRALVEVIRHKNLGRKSWSLGVTFSDEHRENLRLAKLGTKQSEETKRKRSEKLKGIIRSPEFCAAVAAAKLGKKATEEAKAAMRAANRSREPEVRALMSLRVRAAMTPEARQKMRLAKLGKKQSPELVAKRFATIAKNRELNNGANL